MKVVHSVLFCNLASSCLAEYVSEIHAYDWGNNQGLMWERYLEEKVHATAGKEALTVDRSLVRHVPHCRPGRLHHVVADPRLQDQIVRM